MISPFSELTGFAGVGEDLCVALRVKESPAKLCVVVTDEVFRILIWVGGRGGRCSGLFFRLPSGRGACRGRVGGVGAGAWGRGGTGALTQCDRSLIPDWRMARSKLGGGDWGSGRFAICEER